MSELFGDHIPLMRPWLEEEEILAVAEVIRSGWISQGPKVAEFESRLARYVGSQFAVATNSCTTALHLALRCHGITYGDEVICPSFTCMATANAIEMAGAHPVFADIDAASFNLDPRSVESAITAKSRAILAVHQIGLPAEIADLGAIAKRHGLILIEDGACSLGATYNDKKVGGLGAPTTFSFHPRKMITTGEGGMITTNDERLAERAKQLRSTGASISDLDRHKAKGTLIQVYEETGFNYRLTDMQAALGIVQLARIDLMLEQRQQQARRYGSALAELGFVKPPYVPSHMKHAYSSYMVTLDRSCPISRDELLKRMAENGVSCRIGIQPLHWEPVYRSKCQNLSLPVTEQAARSTMFLPIFPGLTDAEQQRVIDVIVSIIKSCGTTARR